MTNALGWGMVAWVIYVTIVALIMADRGITEDDKYLVAFILSLILALGVFLILI